MPERYLSHARDAERLARAAVSDRERRVHLEVATLWHELARRKAERISTASPAGGQPLAAIVLSINEDLQRLIITLTGDIDGQTVADRVRGTFLGQPRVTRMDMVYDLRHLTGAVGATHMDTIAAAYLAGNQDHGPFRTAIVAPDPFYRRWAEALSAQFGREHRAFRTLGEAEPFLSEPLRSRPPFSVAG